MKGGIELMRSYSKMDTETYTYRVNVKR